MRGQPTCASLPASMQALIMLVDSAMHEAVAAIAACGVSPLVRIAANEVWMVKRRKCLFYPSHGTG